MYSHRFLSYTNLHTFSFQLTQLWICDWLLEIRTTLWQDLSQDAEFEKSVSSMSLAGFQRDLACLRQLCQHIPVSVNSSYIFVSIIPYNYIILIKFK